MLNSNAKSSVGHIVLNDRVAVRLVGSEEKTSSGLFLPGGTTPGLQRGTVVAIGQGRLLQDGTWVPLSVACGDEVLFRQGVGVEVTVPKIKTEGESEKLIVIGETDVLMVIAK